MRRWLLPATLALLASLALVGCSNDSPLDPAPDDVDGDGVPTLQDNCPFDANGTQGDCDHDGIGDACDLGDTDGDFVADYLDNCACVPNADQADSDNDGLGDRCEAGGGDRDGDGISDNEEAV